MGGGGDADDVEREQEEDEADWRTAPAADGCAWRWKSLLGLAQLGSSLCLTRPVTCSSDPNSREQSFLMIRLPPRQTSLSFHQFVSLPRLISSSIFPLPLGSDYSTYGHRHCNRPPLVLATTPLQVPRSAMFRSHDISAHSHVHHQRLVATIFHESTPSASVCVAELREREGLTLIITCCSRYLTPTDRTDRTPNHRQFKFITRDGSRIARVDLAAAKPVLAKNRLQYHLFVPIKVSNGD